MYLGLFGSMGASVRAVFVDANDELATFARKVMRPGDPPVGINLEPDVRPEDLPARLGGAEIIIIDHTDLPTAIARTCEGLRHVVFLGTGARSYMNPEELAEHGITVHIIKGYGDTSVAECAIMLMWAAAKDGALMDRGMREGQWLRREGMELKGKRLGLIGFGGIAAEVARIAGGSGLEVVAWNRSARSHLGVAFLPLEEVLATSDIVSMHLLLDDETRGFLSAERIAGMKPGAILINTARGALIDETALVEALRSGHLRHAGLDVFTTEPLPAGHPLASLPNVTLSAHSAFRTPEASENLLAAALEHCRRIAATGR